MISIQLMNRVKARLTRTFATAVPLLYFSIVRYSFLLFAFCCFIFAVCYSLCAIVLIFLVEFSRYSCFVITYGKVVESSLLPK